MTKTERENRKIPLQQVENHPMSFVIMALATGFAVGLLMRFGALTKGLRAYGVVRKII